MPTDEVVPREVKAVRSPQILPLFAIPARATLLSRVRHHDRHTQLAHYPNPGVHRFLKKSWLHVFNQFDTPTAMLPIPPLLL
jgi:hypothetical protein